MFLCLKNLVSVGSEIMSAPTISKTWLRHCLKDTGTDDKLLFVDLEIFWFLDSLRCIVQFEFKKSLSLWLIFLIITLLKLVLHSVLTEIIHMTFVRSREINCVLYASRITYRAVERTLISYDNALRYATCTTLRS